VGSTTTAGSTSIAGSTSAAGTTVLGSAGVRSFIFSHSPVFLFFLVPFGQRGLTSLVLIYYTLLKKDVTNHLLEKGGAKNNLLEKGWTKITTDGGKGLPKFRVYSNKNFRLNSV
jgi:hypothetical protein